jgi:uncharacterized membrane-anchored protein
MIRTRIVWAYVLVQAFFFVGWSGYEEARLTQGERVLVRIVPVDPRDLLSGQYLQLNYEFSRPRELAKKFPMPEIGADIWVVLTLEKEGKFHAPCALSAERPAGLPLGDAALKGRVACCESIEFGIERYYVPEGTQTPDPKELTVRLRVRDDGVARIEQVLLKDKSWP